MATKYIAPAPTGSNSNAGTFASPWLTLAYAYTNTSSGDTIVLLDGTYSWVTASMSNRLVAALNIGKAILDAGLVLATWSVSGALTYSGLGFTRNVGGLFGLSGGGSVFTFDKCKFYSITINPPTFGNGGFMNADNGAFKTINLNSCCFSKFTGNGANASPLYDWCSSADRWNLNNCSFAFNFGTSTTTKMAALMCQSYYTNARFNIKNCIAYGQDQAFDFSVGGGSTVLTITYSCAYGTLHTGTGNINANPLFVDIANDNLNLRPNSPCIGTGTLI